MDDKTCIEHLEKLLEERKSLIELLVAENKSLKRKINQLEYDKKQCNERFDELFSDHASSQARKMALVKENRRLEARIDKMHRELQILKQKETLTDMLIAEREDMKKEIKYLNSIIDGGTNT